MRGENYYSAAASEHRLHRYPTTPPQVFREPTLAWLLAVAKTDSVRRILLFGLSIATLIFLRRALVRTGIGNPRSLIALFLAGGGVALSWLPTAPYSHEIWSGLLIALSLSCYTPAHWRAPIVLGVLACLIRELSLLYLCVMAAFAFHEKNWREAREWLAGIAFFALLFVAHLVMASSLHAPGDLAFTSAGWFYFGGWPFVVQTARLNFYLIHAPTVVLAIWICLGIAGLAGARNPWFSRAALIAGGYMLVFLAVGLPGNAYWGLLYAPLLPIGVVLAPESLLDLASRSLPQTASVLGPLSANRGQQSDAKPRADTGAQSRD
jgi:hypothetical protein